MEPIKILILLWSKRLSVSLTLALRPPRTSNWLPCYSPLLPTSKTTKVTKTGRMEEVRPRSICGVILIFSPLDSASLAADFLRVLVTGWLGNLTQFLRKYSVGLSYIYGTKSKTDMISGTRQSLPRSKSPSATAQKCSSFPWIEVIDKMMLILCARPEPWRQLAVLIRNI